jgi:hypothetical protein
VPRRDLRQSRGEVRLGSEPKSADTSRDEYSFKARFGALIAATGVAGVPRALCHYLGELGLSYADLGFVTHLLSYRWTTAFPFPAQRKLAEQAGIGRTGIQRRVYALQALGYLVVAERFDQRDGRRTSNGYDFTPLLDRLNELILRDWETVWKHRDPLVSDGEEEPADPQPGVDNRPDRSQNDGGRRPQKWVGDHSQETAGAGADLKVGRAHKSAHKEDLPERRGNDLSIKRENREPTERNSHLRTTTTTAPSSPQDVSAMESSATGDDERAIDSIMDEYSDQFRDSRHVASNRSRARSLWQQTTLSPQEFVRALADAGARTAAHATRVDNAMPYFFGVLKGVLRERGFEADDRPRQDRGTPTSILLKVRHELSKRIRPELARRWLDDAWLMEWLPDEERCVLGLADVEAVQKLRLEYFGLLKRTIRELAGRDMRVDVVLLPNATDGP